MVAHIQPFSSGKWHCFNDSSVTLASKKDLEEAFGGCSNKCTFNPLLANSLAFQSGASAYMLMYRKYDPMANIVECSADEVHLLVPD